MDCDPIFPNLFVGSLPRTAADIATLKQQGVTVVLNLQTEEDFSDHGLDWLGLRARYFASGIDVRRVPIRDFDDNDLRDKLPEAVRVLGELLESGQTVYVHCNAGVNRSPSVIICYLLWTQQWSLDDAVSHVTRCHPCAPLLEVVRRATWDLRRGMP